MRTLKTTALALALTCTSLSASTATAPARDLGCTLAFSGKAWSAIVKRGEGTGTVTCADGSTLPVSISANGIGLIAGKWSIEDGKGKFTDVRKIEDVLGTYASVSLDVGAGKAGTAQLLTKGKVSLALEGTGKGVDLGVAVNDFRVARAMTKAVAPKPGAMPAPTPEAPAAK